jgi:hypothetical protein
MRKPRRAALLASGSAPDCPVLRVLAHADAIGPVASTSFRVASRIVNAIRAGRAVPSLEEFENCPLILICVPAPSVDAAVAQLAGAPLEWKRHTVILIGSDTRPLAPLARLGAVTGLVAAVPGFEERLFVLEAERAALRELRPLLAGRGVQIALLPPGARARFDAGVSLAGRVLFPMLAAAGSAFDSTRLPRHLTDSVLEKTVQRAVRAWLRSRRRGWGVLDGNGIPVQIAALKKTDRRAGAYLQSAVAAARRFMRSDGEGPPDQP